MSFTLFQIHWKLFVIFAEKKVGEENINHTFQLHWGYSSDNTSDQMYPETDA